jgi:tetratricopeptide (TPR) repeat protein
MLAVFEWSDRHLSPEEATCFRRLGLFGTSFSLATATAAAADGALDADDVPELLWSLVDKSLVVADLTANDTRYRLLESVRDFARQRLAQHDDPTVAAARLAGWYLEAMGPRRRHARGWTSAVAVEVDNLRALVPVLADHVPERAQQLAYTIGRYLDAAQSYREGIAELTRYVAELTEPTPARISLLTSLGDLYLRTADLPAAERALAAAVDLFERVGSLPDWDDVAIERTQGDLACREGDNAKAVAAARRALSGHLTPRGEARMWSQLGIASLGVGDLATAAEAFGSELEAYRRLGDELYQASAEGNLAEIRLRLGDAAGAASHQKACLRLALELGAPVMVAFSLIIAARIAAGQGQWETTARLHAHAESILESTGLALYDEDRKTSEALLTRARGQLGDSGFERAAASGRALGLLDAAATADALLSAVAGR